MLHFNPKTWFCKHVDRFTTASLLRRRQFWLAAAVLIWAGLPGPLAAQEKLVAPAQQQHTPWTPCATLAVKETFDENIYLQSVTSNAFQHSFITTVAPSVGIAFKPGDTFHANLNYAPELNFFHSASTEDFTVHRVQLGIDGASAKTKWELSENFLAIDGSDIGPSFFGPGGAPAGGGPQIRDRRDAMVERGQIRVTETIGDWFVRPALNGYYHDFQTVQRITPGYQNYVDRSDWNVGADAGYEFTEKAWLTAGFRYGQQTQARLLNFPEHYDSTYYRALFGVEGKLWSWLKLALCAGPEFRRYGDSVAAGYHDRNELCPYVDSVITVTPTTRDVLTVCAKIFEQPGFSGRSTYLDSTYEMTWRRKLTDKLSVGAGLRAYNTDFLKPTERNDWIMTPSVVASYAFNKHLTAEASYLFDDAFSLVPNTQGREYTRNLAAIGIRYSF